MCKNPVAAVTKPHRQRGLSHGNVSFHSPGGHKLEIGIARPNEEMTGLRVLWSPEGQFAPCLFLPPMAASSPQLVAASPAVEVSAFGSFSTLPSSDFLFFVC